tara:strand:- start:317 stop:1174 length:858 start_codon:yes stop_codon:yes gene_type:complete
MSEDGTVNASMDPSAMIVAISDTVSTGIADVARELNRIRQAGNDPCLKEGLMQEHLITKVGLYNNAAASLASYRQDGANAIESSIRNMGRPSSQHMGGSMFAVQLADNWLPTPPNVVAAMLLAQLIYPMAVPNAWAAWVDWIDSRLGTGRPSASTSGPLVLGTVGIHAENNRITGPRVQEAYDDWIEIQELNVTPPFRPNWSAKVEALNARLIGLESVIVQAQEWQATWEIECLDSGRRDRDREDLTLEGQLAAIRDAERTARIKAMAPIAIAGIVALGILRRAR